MHAMRRAVFLFQVPARASLVSLPSRSRPLERAPPILFIAIMPSQSVISNRRHIDVM